MAAPLRVLVTGAAGNIAYSITYMIARGEVFGPKQPVILVLYDLKDKKGLVKGLNMELTDCTMPLLKQIVTTSEPAVAFKDIEAAFLIGALPRQAGMERKDLLAANVKIFKENGQALNQYAKKCVRVVVVGNPCNTMAYICQKFAPTIPPTNFTAMSRLDLNRTSAQIAEKLRVPVESVKNVIVWGNHSKTQVPDVSVATYTVNCFNKKVTDTIKDETYLCKALVNTVADRGALVIAARNKSSAMSAAKAACDHMRDWWIGTPPGQFVCMSVMSDGSYGAPKDVMFSFPVSTSRGHWSIVRGLELSNFVKEKIAITGQELIDERNEALSLIGT